MVNIRCLLLFVSSVTDFRRAPLEVSINCSSYIFHTLFELEGNDNRTSTLLLSESSESHLTWINFHRLVHGVTEIFKKGSGWNHICNIRTTVSKDVDLHMNAVERKDIGISYLTIVASITGFRHTPVEVSIVHAKHRSFVVYKHFGWVYCKRRLSLWYLMW